LELKGKYNGICNNVDARSNMKMDKKITHIDMLGVAPLLWRSVLRGHGIIYVREIIKSVYFFVATFMTEKKEYQYDIVSSVVL
jgi:hypothetical protein